jgi:hypothetical protein
MEVIFDSLAGEICKNCEVVDCNMCPKVHEVKSAQEFDEIAEMASKK